MSAHLREALEAWCVAEGVGFNSGFHSGVHRYVLTGRLDGITVSLDNKEAIFWESHNRAPDRSARTPRGMRIVLRFYDACLHPNRRPLRRAP